MTLRISKNRKAISPVLATVILIAITLIAAIAIAGFVFGLFGSFTSSAQVSAQVQTCAAGTGVCTVKLTNTGTSNVAETGCFVRLSGVNTAGVVTFAVTVPATTATVPASASGTYICTPPATAQTAGSQAIGSFTMSNGASVPFSGVWS